ncbi:MAG TPA: sigma-70 family RNA polymerase sigma factor [Steroidobacteraceae bacterium]|nr:sigma-70 family RNA polymerase sigma factor [Steroidobacteraceae bacterium]
MRTCHFARWEATTFSMSSPPSLSQAPDDAGAAPLERDERDDLYHDMVVQFGPALARLAAAYEADPAHREDLLQDIHLALWRSFGSFGRQCALRTWVYRVAHNTAASHVRRHRRGRRPQLVGLEELEAIANDTDGERLADAERVLEALGALIQRLKAIDRQVLLLYLEGLEVAEIAEVVGLSSNHVSQKVLRTRKLLARQFRTGDSYADSE